MRRFWLLLLVLVLPLQMSWAAAHSCNDQGLVAAAVAGATVASHDHHDSGLVKQSSDGQQSEKIADSCCEASHGCQGLHHLIAQADSGFAPREASVMPAPSGAAPPLSDARSRIERPNWLAA